jgi:hypothetical protein
MKFSPFNLTLYTDSNEPIKTLHCPHKKQWNQLHPQPDSPHRSCPGCNHPVLDTAHMTDLEVLAAVRQNPSTCLAVNPAQDNIRLLPPQNRICS